MDEIHRHSWNVLVLEENEKPTIFPKTQIDVFLCERPDHNLPGKSWKQIQVEHVRTTLKTRISVLRLFNMLLICV